MKNSMAKTLRTMAYIIFIVGIAGSFILVEFMWVLTIAGIAATIINCILLFGFAEVIDLLQEIANGQKEMQVGSNSAGMPQTQEEMVSDIESDLPQL